MFKTLVSLVIILYTQKNIESEIVTYTENKTGYAILM